MAVVVVVPSPLVKIRGFLRGWLGLLSSQSPPCGRCTPCCASSKSRSGGCLDPGGSAVLVGGLLQSKRSCQCAAPALAVQGPASLLEPTGGTAESNETPSFLDNIFWMAAPKSRRTIEVNRCRRRNPRNLLKIKRNIDLCPECGHVKQKHVLCGYCYEKVRQETTAIKAQILVQEGGPHRAPAVETVVLYKGEKPREQDEGKRIIERARKRPSWFTLD